MSAIAFNGEIFPSGARAASDQIYDNSNTGLPANVQGAIDKTTGNISSLDTVELTATAAHAHAVDSTFLWIGQLVKATAAIAVGDTIALGINVTNTDICSILSKLNSNLAGLIFEIVSKNFASVSPSQAGFASVAVDLSRSNYYLVGYIHKQLTGSSNGNLIPTYNCIDDSLIISLYRPSAWGECTGVRGIAVYHTI